ncbi:hypothetical protein GCM10009100_09870 [Thalassospira tepidiphila]
MLVLNVYSVLNNFFEKFTVDGTPSQKRIKTQNHTCALSTNTLRNSPHSFRNLAISYDGDKIRQKTSCSTIDPKN